MVTVSLNWLQRSFSIKIGGLSATLLGFLLVVIVYSIIKLVSISNEMREVAEVDIPLTQVVTEVEILQLEQHIVLEKIRLNDPELKNKTTVVVTQLFEQFESNNKAIDKYLIQANSVISNAISDGLVIQKLDEHHQIMEALTQFRIERARFTAALLEKIDVNNAARDEVDWVSVENTYNQLDRDIESLLKNLELLLADISLSAQKHTNEFMVVNVALGLCALFSGILITVFIINSIRNRLEHIQAQLMSITDMTDKQAVPMPLAVKQNDEFSALSNSINSVVGGFVSELNSRYEVEKELIKLTVTDKLTGAYNRHKWDESLAIEMDLATRGTTFSIIAVDLDYFKKVNDTFGHNVGDQVLSKAVELMKANIRKTDAVYRLGGEEFVILTRQASKSDAAIIADKVRQAFESYKQASIPQFTASFGVTEYMNDDDEKSLLNRADEALYKSKADGRNCVTVS